MMISFCGADCHECEARLATQENDDQKRAQVAQKWSVMYNTQIKPEQISCTGCKSKDGPLFFYCNVCEIRKCAKEKQVVNCAVCSEYACDKLEDFFKLAPEARKTLENLRNEI